MGGVVNTIKSIGSNVVHNPIGGLARIGGDVMTFGTNELLGNPIGKIGNFLGGSGGSGSLSPAQIGGQQSPLDMLTSSGGAPLLGDIALGVSPQTALGSFFGVNISGGKDFDNWLASLSDQDRAAVQSLNTQLTQIQTQTDTQNNAVNQLVKDYPNLMTQKIQQYQNIADPAIQKMMGQAMQQLNAQQAAGGSISSGAAAAAASQVGAQYAGQELDYATGLANQDFNQQLSAAMGLQSFQQKMLGQGAQQGFSAVQNALQRNTQIATGQAQLNQQSDMYNQQQNQAMWGALGSLGGTIAGSLIGGPVGGAIGGQLGSTFMGGAPPYGGAPSAFSGSFGAPKLQPLYNPSGSSPRLSLY